MACPSCPQCGDSMKEVSIYGAKSCQCDSCGYKVPVQKTPVKSLKEYISKEKKK